MPLLFDSYAVNEWIQYSFQIYWLFYLCALKCLILSHLLPSDASPLVSMLPNNKIHLHVWWMNAFKWCNIATSNRLVDTTSKKNGWRNTNSNRSHLFVCRKLWMIIECFLVCVLGFLPISRSIIRWNFPQKKLNHTRVPLKVQNTRSDDNLFAKWFVNWVIIVLLIFWKLHCIQSNFFSSLLFFRAEMRTGYIIKIPWN